MRVMIVALVLVLGSAPAAVADGRFAAVSAAMRQLVADGEVPSIAAAAARDGRILWEDACGWADLERAVPATPHTPYSLASISKPFTATAVMQLVESGRLALDRPANDYLGDARIAGSQAERATVRRLLSHTAGLSTFYRQFAGAPPPMDEIIARHALLTPPAARRGCACS
jgi:CubicO group peptidase (beta-lactamase class C family)